MYLPVSGAIRTSQARQAIKDGMVTRHRVSIWRTRITARQGGPRRWSMYIDIEGLDGDPRSLETFRTRLGAVHAARRIMRRHARSKYRIRWERISSNFYTGATDED